HDAGEALSGPGESIPTESPLTAQLLSLFAEPGVYTVTPQGASEILARPLTDVENALEALSAAGELIRAGGATPRYHISEARKAQLEHMFEEAALEIGETQALVRYQNAPLAAFDDAEEPRLPVTAGLLSLFLPGTGQLLNGDV